MNENTKLEENLIFLFRLTMGGMFLCAGGRQVLDPKLTVATFLAGVVAYLTVKHAGHVWGLDGLISKPSFIERNSRLALPVS